MLTAICAFVIGLVVGTYGHAVVQAEVLKAIADVKAEVAKLSGK